MAEERHNPFRSDGADNLTYQSDGSVRPDVARRWLRAHLDSVAQPTSLLHDVLESLLSELDRHDVGLASGVPAAPEPTKFDPWWTSIDSAERHLRDRAGRAEVTTLRAVFEEPEDLRNTTNLAPEQGLSYTDPSGNYTCVPSHENWRTHAQSPDGPSVLELRVMAAHLATALDNVTQALRAKGVMGR